jgi:hypothetical protein
MVDRDPPVLGRGGLVEGLRRVLSGGRLNPYLTAGAGFDDRDRDGLRPQHLLPGQLKRKL